MVKVMHCRSDAPGSNLARAISEFFSLKNGRHLDFHEHSIKEKFHVRMVKCLVRVTERKMSFWRMETSDDRFEDVFSEKSLHVSDHFLRTNIFSILEFVIVLRSLPGQGEGWEEVSPLQSWTSSKEFHFSDWKKKKKKEEKKKKNSWMNSAAHCCSPF